MRHQTIVELPQKGQEQFFDRGEGLEGILEILSKLKGGFTITIMSVAGGGVGKLRNPTVVKHKKTFAVIGERTSDPEATRCFWFCTDDKHVVPPREMLAAISSIYVKCD